MKLIKCIGVYAVILLVFILILSLESEMTRVTTGDDRLYSAYYLAEKMRNESNLDYHLQAVFADLYSDVIPNLNDLSAIERPPDRFRRFMPYTSLTVALADTEGRLLEHKAFDGGFSRELCLEMVQIDKLFRRRNAPDYPSLEYKQLLGLSPLADENQIKQAFKAKTMRASMMINQSIGVSFADAEIIQRNSRRPNIFDSDKDTTILFWDRATLGKDRILYMFCSFKTSSINDELPLLSFLQANSNKIDRLAYYDTNLNRMIGEVDLDSTEADELIQRLSQASQSGPSDTALINIFSESVLMGRLIAGTDYRPLVFIEKNAQPQSLIKTWKGIGIFLLACVILMLVVETLVFSRGIRLNVSRVLIISMFVAILMPFMMGRSVFSMILREASEAEQLRLERQLNSSLGAIDSGLRLMHTNIYHLIFNRVNQPDYLNLLVAQSDLPPKTEENSLPVLMDIVQLCRAVFINNLAERAPRAQPLNILALFGPHEFLRLYDRFTNEEKTRSQISSINSTMLFLSYVKKVFEGYFPSTSFADGFRFDNEALSPGFTLMLEEVGTTLRASVGDARFHQMLTNYGGLNSIRTSVGYSMFAVFPLMHNDLITFFFGVGWDEFIIGPLYFSRVIDLINKRENSESEAKQDSWFSLFRPENIFPRPPIFIQAVGGLNGQVIKSSDKVNDPRMDNLIKNSFRNRTVFREYVEGDEPSLYQVVPGRYTDLYAIGGLQKTGYLGNIENLYSWLFNLGMLLFLVFALFAAINLSASFTSPLDHLLWGLNKVEKQDLDVILKDSREDELGSISRSFNNMVRQLKERATLEKFVTPSVKKLAENPDLFERAQQGIEEKATIVFADLEGFDRLLDQGDEILIHQSLSDSLALFHEAAEKFGAEIDKVIGQKLLLVFRHSKHGCKKNAVLAAVGLCSHVLAGSENVRLKPIFGINSGTVISGIIGTRKVRMDYTIIGDPVNVAARLSTLASSAQAPILVSGSVKDSLPKRFKVMPAHIGKVRGKKQEVEVFSLRVKGMRQV